MRHSLRFEVGGSVFVTLDKKHFHEDADPKDAWAFFAEKTLDPKSLRRKIYVVRFESDNLYHLTGIRTLRAGTSDVNSNQRRYTSGNLGILEFPEGLKRVCDLEAGQLFYVIEEENRSEYKFLE